MPGTCEVCNEPSALTCAGCKLINYCCKDHQKIHWKQTHKGNCQPLFKLEENEKLGRHLVATRDIRKGELIFQESPLVVGPKSVTVPICLGCHSPCSPHNYHECDGCGFPLCSVKCQVSDYHIDECRMMMKAKFKAKFDLETNKKEISYFPIVPLRCLLLKEKNPDRYARITNLQSHLNERINEPLFEVYKKNVAEFLRKRLGRTDFEEKEILTISGILDTNTFEIRTKTSKLRGLYNVASMLSHNCKPNTKHNFLQPEMTILVWATTDINSGQIISATYTQTFWDTLSRREHLKLVKCFECDCQRCSDATELGSYAGAIRCVRCSSSDSILDGPYIINTDPLNPSAPWKCENCGHLLTAKQIKTGNESLKEELSKPEMRTAEGLEGFLEKYETHGSRILHPRNYHVIQVKYALIQIYGNKAGFMYSELKDHLLEKKLKYCHELLEVADVLDPGFSRTRGEILNELQSSMVIQAKRQFEKGIITKDDAQVKSYWSNMIGGKMHGVAMKILMNAFEILKEVIEILRFELEMDEFKNRLMLLSKELGD